MAYSAYQRAVKSAMWAEAAAGKNELEASIDPSYTRASDYQWMALRLRKKAKMLRKQAQALLDITVELQKASGRAKSDS